MGMLWNGDVQLRAIERAAAKGLLAAALTYENELRQKVSVPNPPPYTNSSKPGEYPRLRTGAGQKAITHEPASVEDVVKTGSVRVGYREGDHHLLILELARKRKGLLETLEAMRPTLARLAVGEFKG